MGSLTAFGIYQRLDRLRPSPSRLECGPSYRSPANIDKFQFSLIKGPHLIRVVKTFSFHLYHLNHLLSLFAHFFLFVKRGLLEIQLSSRILTHNQTQKLQNIQQVKLSSTGEPKILFEQS
jgi:hypothetical protein